jgi:hypothetical protein
MKSKTTTSTISVLFREEEHEKMRIFERALPTRCERVTPEVVVLHVQPGFCRQKDGVA